MLSTLSSFVPAFIVFDVLQRTEFGMLQEDILGISCCVGFPSLLAGIVIRGRALDFARGVAKHENLIRAWVDADFSGRMRKVIEAAAIRSSLSPMLYASVAQATPFILYRFGGQYNDPESVPNSAYIHAGLALLLFASVASSTKSLLSSIEPTRSLLEQCLTAFSNPLQIHPENKSAKRLAISRWRGNKHRSANLAAAYLTRSIRGLQRKLSTEDYARMDRVYSKVGHLLKQKALQAQDGKFDSYYAELCCSIIALATNDNIVQVCKDIENIISEESGVVEPQKRRWSLFLESLDGTLQRHSRVATAFLATSLLVLLIATGQFETAIDFISQLLPRGAP